VRAACARVARRGDLVPATDEEVGEPTRSTFLKKRLMSIVGDEVDVRFFVAEAMAP